MLQGLGIRVVAVASSTQVGTPTRRCVNVCMLRHCCMCTHELRGMSFRFHQNGVREALIAAACCLAFFWAVWGGSGCLQLLVARSRLHVA